jgi:hypothetical protein
MIVWRGARTVRLQFEPRDLWIGVYWSQVTHPDHSWMYRRRIYVCIVPMLPIVYTGRWRTWS